MFYESTNKENMFYAQQDERKNYLESCAKVDHIVLCAINENRERRKTRRKHEKHAKKMQNAQKFVENTHHHERSNWIRWVKRNTMLFVCFRDCPSWRNEGAGVPVRLPDRWAAMRAHEKTCRCHDRMARAPLSKVVMLKYPSRMLSPS